LESSNFTLLNVPPNAIMYRRIGSWQFDHCKYSIYATAFANDDDEDGQPTGCHSVNWGGFTSVEKTRLEIGTSLGWRQY
jgi:hypothetical protein